MATEYTKEALDKIARIAADAIMADLNGDHEGANAKYAQARIVADQPKSKKK